MAPRALHVIKNNPTIQNCGLWLEWAHVNRVNRGQAKIARLFSAVNNPTETTRNFNMLVKIPAQSVSDGNDVNAAKTQN